MPRTEELNKITVNWKENNYPFKNFTEELTQEWINCGFNKKQTREWLEAELQPTEANLAKWLRDVKKQTATWLLDKGDLEELRREYESYLASQNEQTTVSTSSSSETSTSLSQVAKNIVIDRKWLEENYPDRLKRNEEGTVYIVDLTDLNLSGDLDVSEFDKRWTIDTLQEKRTSHSPENQVIINGNPNLGKIIDRKEKKTIWKTTITLNPAPKRVSAQEYIEVNINQTVKKSVQILYLPFKNLTDSVDFSEFKELIELGINNNELTSLILPSQLTYLECSHNPQLDYVLLPIQQLANLKKFDCTYTKFAGELEFYGYNYLAWAEAHPELFKKHGLEPVINSYQATPQLVTEIPTYLITKYQTKENFDLTNIQHYSQFTLLRDPRYFSWELTKKPLPLLPNQLPTRLYNLQTKQLVESAKTHPQIKNYAILSYVWTEDYNATTKSLVDKLSTGGQKALRKAEKALEFINQSARNKINHLWMDQLCINQRSVVEKNKEVPKMKDYYSQTECTLVPINFSLSKLSPKFLIEKKKTEDWREKYKWKEYQETNHPIVLAHTALSVIINSSWFQRTWTFQEGWLSKQTIFMFDDYLVDGRMMAQLLVNAVLEKSGQKIEFEIPIQYLTPLGSNYTSNHQIKHLDLWHALNLVKNRKRVVTIDGIYAILGLIKNGEKVSVKYKPRICLNCPNQTETIDCFHREVNKYWPAYKVDDFEQVLEEIIQINPFYSLTWLGSRRTESHLWKLKMPFFSNRGLLNLTEEELIDVDKLELEQHQSSFLKITDNTIRILGWELKVGKGRIYPIFAQYEGKFYFNIEVIDWRGINDIAETTLIIPTQTFLKKEHKLYKYSFLAISVPSSESSKEINFLELRIKNNEDYDYFQVVKLSEEIEINMVQKTVTKLNPITSLPTCPYLTLQEYLEQKYPTQTDKEQVTEITINEKNKQEFQHIRGEEMDFSIFPNLEKIVITSDHLKSRFCFLKLDNPKLTNLCFACLPLSNNQNHCSTLDLSRCPKLTLLNCCCSQLTNIIIPINNQLKEIYCYGNPNLSSDFLLYLNLGELTNLELDINARSYEEDLSLSLVASQLKSYLRPGEKIGRGFLGYIKPTSELLPNEVNYVILLVRWRQTQQIQNSSNQLLAQIQQSVFSSNYDESKDKWLKW